MKKLPNEFTFICDEHSREQLEQLGVEFEGFDISDVGFYYLVENSKVQQNNLDQIAGCPLIYLSDYIDQEQPEPKWQPLTRGGFNCVVFEEFNNQLFGGVEVNGKWYGATWDLDGNFNCLKLNDFWDLLPINNELTTLEKELEEVRSKEKEILEKIEGLKK